ncbi:MAG: deoxyribodipyrimidine photo-lyase, partial [Propionibacteriaceae bacterium]
MAPAERPVIWWVRRDFRLADNPALGAAVDAGAAVLPLFVSDPVLRRSAGLGRSAWLTAAVADLHRVLREAGGPGLTVLEGRPEDVVPRLAAAVSHANRPRPADRRRTGSLTKRGSTAAPAST